MKNEDLISTLEAMSAELNVKQGVQYVEATIPANGLHAFMQAIKENSSLSFDYMICLTGVDYPEYIQVVYHLQSVTHRHVLVVKVNTDGRETPALDTVSDVWPAAEFHECEVYDLLGVRFNNHPDLRRLFMDDTWGYPLRKDFKDDIHIVSR